MEQQWKEEEGRKENGFRWIAAMAPPPFPHPPPEEEEEEEEKEKRLAAFVFPQAGLDLSFPFPPCFQGSFCCTLGYIFARANKIMLTQHYFPPRSSFSFISLSFPPPFLLSSFSVSCIFSVFAAEATARYVSLMIHFSPSAARERTVGE